MLTEKQKRENAERAQKGEQFLKLASELPSYDADSPQDIISDILHALAKRKEVKLKPATYAAAVMKLAFENFRAELAGEE